MQIDASGWPNKTQVQKLRRLASPFGQGFTLFNLTILLLQLQDGDDCTPLFYALLKDNKAMVEYLLQMVRL